MTRRFIHEYDPTLESVYSFSADLEGDQVDMNLLDTAGKSRPNDSEAQWGDGFLLVVSLTCPDSVRTAIDLHSWLEAQAPGKPLVLVATKRDLVQARAVSSHELLELGDRWNCDVHETSATGDYEDVYRPFLAIAKQARALRARKLLFPNLTPEQLVVPESARRYYKTRQLTK